ncbi:MAG TPA: hypothetical protein VI386_35400 [Candidatus Sulfotelmatobacter sp.]
MKTQCVAIISCCLMVSMTGGYQNKQGVKTSVNAVSEMATAAAKGDYLGGITVGENYLRDNPGDTNVLEQTAILTLAQAKQDPKNREVLVSRAVLLLERPVNSSGSEEDSANRFANRFMAARAFESAGDLSSDKCSHYGRALSLNNEAATVVSAELLKLGDGKEVSTKPLREQSGKLQSELEKRVSESRCGK